MAEQFLTCPKCHSDNWNDIPNTKDRNRTRFRCSRCGFMVLIKVCRQCGAENWVMEKGIEEKGGWRPFYRFRCRGCGRLLRIKIWS